MRVLTDEQKASKKAYQKKYREDNPEKILEIAARRFWRKEGMLAKDIPSDLLRAKITLLKLVRLGREKKNEV